MTPKRIQMSRQKPWRAENPDAVIVARPSKWGNPFTMEWAKSYWDGYRVNLREAVVSSFRTDVEFEVRPDYPNREAIRAELAGRDLACWCPLDQPCHADVLLELANSTSPARGSVDS